MRAQEFINEISDEQLQRYLDRAGSKVDRRMTRMAQARDRLNKGYEIYHAETPNKVVDRFAANTPAEAQRYYADYIRNYESDVDYDLRLRRATGIIEEAFDQPYPIKWETGEYGAYDALVKLPDGTNLSINFNLESAGPYGEDEQWHVEFWRNNSLAVTGEGDAYRIFATVLEAIEQFIGEENPEHVEFSASKDVEPGQNTQSRAKLYDRLLQRYAASWGYNVARQDRGDAVNYDLTRKASVKENFTEGKYDANPATYDLPRRPLNVPELIKRGAIFITEPHGPNGWEPNSEGFSLITLYNVMKGGWPAESKQHLKPSMYKVAATGLNRQGPGTMLYDGKYNQILWSIKKLGIPEEVAFLDAVEENFADGKKPGRKGLAKRVGVNCKQSVSKLRKIAKNSSGERARMAHWCANMKSGKKKNK